MKNVFMLIFLLISTTTFGQGKSKLTIDWQFTGIIEGYDHDSKVEVFIDDVLAATSTVSKQSKKNSVTVIATRGTHKVRIVNFALYENQWEEHSHANDYSLDAVYDSNLMLKKKNKISLIFDIDKEIVIESVK
jgi:hypothetical protein